MSYSVLVEKDVSIRLRDGGAIVADVFRPAEPGEFPTIMTLGPYPKDIHRSQDSGYSQGRRGASCDSG
jgi:predicted acyl esterase